MLRADLNEVDHEERCLAYLIIIVKPETEILILCTLQALLDESEFVPMELQSANWIFSARSAIMG